LVALHAEDFGHAPRSGTKRAIVTASGLFLLCTLVVGVAPLGSLAVLSVMAAVFSGIAVVLGFSVGIAFLLISLAFSNTMAAVLTPYLGSRASYQALVGIPLATMVFLFISATLRLSKVQIAQHSSSLLISYLYFLSIILFSIIGASHGYGVSVIYYMRYFVAVPMLYIIAVACKRSEATTALDTMCILAACYTALIVFEVLFAGAYSSLLNRMDFYKMKYESGSVLLLNEEDYKDFLQRPLFNLSGQLRLPFEIYRPTGPFLHSISSAYFLLAGVVAYLLTRGNRRLAFLMGLSIIFMQSKGVIFSGSIILFSYVVFLRTKSLIAAIAVATLGMLGGVMLTMYVYTLVPDPHVSGLLGGIRAFVDAPFGAGLGAGGNLGSIVMNWEVKVSETVIAGYESAYGVLVHQMGIFAAFFVFLHFSTVREILSQSRSMGALAAISVIVFQVPLLFQEEALSQVSLPLLIAVLLFVAKTNGAADDVPFAQRKYVSQRVLHK
jgi:hypothetical protein